MFRVVWPHNAKVFVSHLGFLPTLLRQMLLAVAFLAGKDTVHQNVKGDNILYRTIPNMNENSDTYN